MPEELTAEVKSLLKDAAAKLTGPDKRNFMAKATLGLFDGSARKAETYMGWNRQSVEVGLHELHTGIICMDNYHARGNKKTEEKLSALERDIRSLVKAHSQADPQMRRPWPTHASPPRLYAKHCLERKATGKGSCRGSALSAPCSIGWATVCGRSKRPNLKKNAGNRRYFCQCQGGQQTS